jgi:hypothetical protein
VRFQPAFQKFTFIQFALSPRIRRYGRPFAKFSFKLYCQGGGIVNAGKDFFFHGNSIIIRFGKNYYLIRVCPKIMDKL